MEIGFSEICDEIIFVLNINKLHQFPIRTSLQPKDLNIMETKELNIPVIQKTKITEKKIEVAASSCCSPKNDAAVCCAPSSTKDENEGACCAQPEDGSSCCNK
jgi:hypothetical protein